MNILLPALIHIFGFGPCLKYTRLQELPVYGHLENLGGFLGDILRKTFEGCSNKVDFSKKV